MDQMNKLNWSLYDNLLTVAAYVLLGIALLTNQNLFTSILFVGIVVVMMFCAMVFRALSYKYQAYKYKAKVRPSHPLWSSLQTAFLSGGLFGTTILNKVFSTDNATITMVFTITMCILAQMCSWRNDRWRTMSKETVGKKL